MGYPAVLNHSKPSRSEELLDPEEQLRIAEAVRQRFESMAPKRHRKPYRSDLHDDDDFEDEEDDDGNDDHQVIPAHEIPEYHKFHSLLLSGSIQNLSTHAATVYEEFVETDYYDDLNSVDKSLHHTTGTGFIKVEPVHPPSIINGYCNGDGYCNGGTFIQCPKFRTNPARNDDWGSYAEAMYTAALVLSNKPGRSDP